MSSESDSDAEGRGLGSLPSRIGDHQKTITMATIAKAAGVSQGAISSLLNDRDYGIRVSEKTRERVFKVCREMNYVPNDLRAVVRMYPLLGDLCFLVSNDIPDIAGDPFQSRVLKGLMEAVPNPSHAVTVAHFDPAVDYTSVAVEGLPQPLSNGTTSRFICSGRLNPSLFQTLVKQEHPGIALGQEIALPGITSILPDYAQASKLAIEYLFGLGHRRIAILSGPFGTAKSNIIELNHGVRAAYQQVGAPIEAQNIIYGDLTFQAGFSTVDVLLDRDSPPTAIYCLNDSAAAGVIARAQSRGLKVPADLSVLGCSDDRAADTMYPALSTIHLPAEEMGATAYRELEGLLKIAEEALTKTKKIVLPVRLVERQSCAAPRQAEVKTI
jgi:DNA-binding LacI/PurR family transcriptional regulator